MSPKIWRRLSLTSSFPESEDMIIPKVVPVARSTIHWLQLLPLLMFPLLLRPTLFFPPKVTNRTYLGRQKRYKPPLLRCFRVISPLFLCSKYRLQPSPFPRRHLFQLRHFFFWLPNVPFFSFFPGNEQRGGEGMKISLTFTTKLQRGITSLLIKDRWQGVLKKGKGGQ